MVYISPFWLASQLTLLHAPHARHSAEVSIMATYGLGAPSIHSWKSTICPNATVNNPSLLLFDQVKSNYICQRHLHVVHVDLSSTSVTVRHVRRCQQRRWSSHSKKLGAGGSGQCLFLSERKANLGLMIWDYRRYYYCTVYSKNRPKCLSSLTRPFSSSAYRWSHWVQFGHQSGKPFSPPVVRKVLWQWTWWW